MLHLSDEYPFVERVLTKTAIWAVQYCIIQRIISIINEIVFKTECNSDSISIKCIFELRLNFQLMLYVTLDF